MWSCGFAYIYHFPPRLVDFVQSTIFVPGISLASGMLLEHIFERHPVGVTTFTLPVPTIQFGNATYKENGKPALVLSEVGFAIYYPTETGLSTNQYPYLDWAMRYAPAYAGPNSCRLIPPLCSPISNTVMGFSLVFGELFKPRTTAHREAPGALYWILWGFFYLFLSFIKVIGSRRSTPGPG